MSFIALAVCGIVLSEYFLCSSLVWTSRLSRWRKLQRLPLHSRITLVYTYSYFLTILSKTKRFSRLEFALKKHIFSKSITTQIIDDNNYPLYRLFSTNQASKLQQAPHRHFRHLIYIRTTCEHTRVPAYKPSCAYCGVELAFRTAHNPIHRRLICIRNKRIGAAEAHNQPPATPSIFYRTPRPPLEA